MELNRKSIKRIIFIIAIAIIMFWAAQNFMLVLSIVGRGVQLLSPLIIGFCIAFVLNVIVRIFEDHLYKPLDLRNNRFWSAFRRPLSIILSLGIVIGIILFIVVLVIPELERTVKILIVDIPQYIEHLQVVVADLAVRFDLNIEFPKFELDWNKATEWLDGFIKSEASSDVFNTAVGVTTTIFSSFFNIIMGIVFSIYMLLRKETLGRQAKQIIYAFFPKKAADEMVYIGTLSNRIFSKFVTGQMTEAVIIGTLCFIGMSIFSWPYALTISVLVGFTALIPVFGAFIGTAIGAFLILMVDPMAAFWFIVFIVVLQQLEGNLIYPKVVGTSVGLPAIWVMLAVLIGGNTGGVMGMLISVPITSVLYCLIRRSVVERLDGRQI